MVSPTRIESLSPEVALEVKPASLGMLCFQIPTTSLICKEPTAPIFTGAVISVAGLDGGDKVCRLLVKGLRVASKARLEFWATDCASGDHHYIACPNNRLYAKKRKALAEQKAKLRQAQSGQGDGQEILEGSDSLDATQPCTQPAAPAIADDVVDVDRLPPEELAGTDRSKTPVSLDVWQ